MRQTNKVFDADSAMATPIVINQSHSDSCDSTRKSHSQVQGNTRMGPECKSLPSAWTCGGLPICRVGGGAPHTPPVDTLFWGTLVKSRAKIQKMAGAPKFK